MAKWSDKVRENVQELSKLWSAHRVGDWLTRDALFTWGLTEGLITQEEYESAKSYYGKFWTYSGD